MRDVMDSATAEVKRGALLRERAARNRRAARNGPVAPAREYSRPGRSSVRCPVGRPARKLFSARVPVGGTTLEVSLMSDGILAARKRSARRIGAAAAAAGK